jgi:ADP-heptose:LPS heptosyltransferase
MAERCQFQEATGHELLSPNFNKRDDLESLAALITACDAVVSVSNVTAHLAGSLGIRGFVLLPAGKGLIWYWRQEGNPSPWYPTLSIIRQQLAGSWEKEVKEVQKLLLNEYRDNPPY